MPDSHCFFSASSSARRVDCPASAVVDATRFARRSTRAADHGTRLHAIAEEALRTGKEALEVDPSLEASDAASVQAYVDYARSLSVSGWECCFEYPARLTPLLGGTADFVGFSPDGRILKVVDYKSGSYAVAACENQQLLVYGAAVLKQLGPIYDEVEEVHLEIVQPAVDSRPLRWVVPGGTAQVREAGLRHEALVDEIVDGVAEFNPTEEACRWCDARSGCPAYAAMALEAARREFAEHRDAWGDDGELEAILEQEPDELSWSDKLRIAPLAANWARMVEAEAKEKLLQDPDAIPGRKVVEGRRVRDWNGERGRQGAQFYLQVLHGFDDSDIFGERPFVSPHKAEQLFTGKGSTALRRGLEGYTYKRHGPPTLVDSDDGRPAISRADLVRWEFEGAIDADSAESKGS